MLPSLLILIGIFYLFAAVVASKAHLVGAVFDTALRAIEARQMRPVEFAQLAWLLLGAFWVGLAGLFALLRLQGVVAFFVLSFLWQALYLFVLAPRYFDPIDEPDAKGRAQTWRAFIFYGIVTTTIAWTTGQGNTLEAFSQTLRWKQSLAILIPACALVYLCHRAWQAVHWPNQGKSNEDRPTGSHDESSPTESVYGEDSTPFIERDNAIPVLIRPSWNEGGLFNDRTGEAIDHPQQRLGISEQQFDLVGDWLCLWRDHADASDPQRHALLHPDSLPLIEAAGQALAETFRGILGAERVSFSPLALPCPPKMQVSALRLMCDYQCNALWFDGDDEGVGDIPTEQLGLSWALSRDLDAWALSFDESLDITDPGGRRLWSKQQDEEHEREGQALLARLRNELDATERASVRIRQ